MAMPVIHVACAPMHSGQGTQAAIRHMLEAHVRAGHRTHLITYHAGAWSSRQRFAVHTTSITRVAPKMRSGPAWSKVLHDLALVPLVRRIVRDVPDARVIAHHVESAAVCAAARVPRWAYVAHTDLQHELPVYAPAPLRAPAAAAGCLVDRWCCRRAFASLAVAPRLAADLSARVRRTVHPLPIPWPHRMRNDPAPDPLSPRRAEGPSVIYRGNLDDYQGWPVLLRAVVPLPVHLRIFTDSDPAPLYAECSRLRISGSRVHVCPLAQATAPSPGDVMAVPRRIKGGVAVKLLDALRTPLAIVVDAHALGGHDAIAHLPGVHVTTAHAESAWVTELRNALGSQARPLAWSNLDRREQYLRRHHGDLAYLGQMARVFEGHGDVPNTWVPENFGCPTPTPYHG